MPYDALTLDTSAFHRAGLRLESGLLGQLSQFADLPSDLVLSEIVTRELVRHLTQNGKKTRDAAISALTDVDQQQLSDKPLLDELKALLRDSREVAPKRVAAFSEAADAAIVPASLCPIDHLLKLYFSSGPPFAAAGDKKSEFPDAIALITLDKWAESQGKKILAVSADKGWAEYAATSDHIDVEPDLATALQIFQQHAAEARATITTIVAAIEAGDLPELAKLIAEFLADELIEQHFDPEGNSYHYFEAEAAGIELDSFNYGRIGNDLDIKIVRIGEDEIAARIGIEVKATAKANFSLQHFDNIDREYVSLGTTEVGAAIEFDGAILVTFEGDFTGDPGELDITDFDLLGAPRDVDFGEVEYDPGDWGDYDDFEALLDAEDKGDPEAPPR